MRWVGESQSAVTILMVGSMKPRCHAVAVWVWDLAHKYDIRLSCIWMPCTSTEIMVADNLSKNFDSSEYKLSPRDFAMLCQIFGPFCLDLLELATLRDGGGWKGNMVLTYIRSQRPLTVCTVGSL